MIIFRLKNFSVNNFKNTGSYVFDDKTFIQAPLNIMKAVEMFELDEGEHVTHWLGQMAVDLVMMQFPKIYLTYQAVVSACVESSDSILSRALGTNEVRYIRENYGSPDDFIYYVMYKMLNMTKQDKPDLQPKYFAKWFRSKDPNCLKFTVDDYKVFYKYIGLCLSGQLDPFVTDRDYYGSYSKIQKTPINYNLKNIKTSKSLTDILIRCVQNIRIDLDELPSKVKYYLFKEE